MAVTWTISQCDYTLAETQSSVDYTNVITATHWRASDSDADGNTGSLYGSIGVDTSDLADGWVDYASMTEADVIAMTKSALGAEQVTSIEESIAAQIAALATPTTGAGIPW